MFSVTRTLVLAGVAILAAACSDDSTGSSNNATVQIQLTDATKDYLQSAEVWISRVYLQGGPGNPADTADASTSGRTDLFNKPASPFHVDLLTLSAGTIKNLTDSVKVPAGSYSQLRIVVDSSKVTLKSPWKFDDGTTTRSIKIPSGSTSGVKVKLNSSLTAADGKATTLLADFNVDQSFNVQLKANQANTIQSVSLSPVIMEKSRSQK